MILAVQNGKARTWDMRCRLPPQLKGDHGIVLRLNDQGWNFDRAGCIAHIHETEQPLDFHGVFRGGRNKLQIIEPGKLFGGPLRDQGHGKHVPVLCLFAAPT